VRVRGRKEKPNATPLRHSQWPLAGRRTHTKKMRRSSGGTQDVHVKARSKRPTRSTDCPLPSIAFRKVLGGGWVWCAVVVAPPTLTSGHWAVISHPLPICHGPLGLVLTQRNPLLRMTVGPGREASPSAGPHRPSFRVRSVRFTFDPIARAAGRRPIGAVRRWGPVTPNTHTPIGRCQMRRGSVVPDVVRYAVEVSA